MKKSVFIVLIFWWTFQAAAQLQTSYQKKCYNLTINFIESLGVDKSYLKGYNSLNDLEGLLVTRDIIQKIRTKRGLILSEIYKIQLREAEKLKTSIDFEREKKAKEKEFSLKQTDYTKLKYGIKSEYDKWLRKNEFERSEVYNQRIINNSQIVFDSICFKNIDDQIKSTFFTAHLFKYNSETEKFDLEIEINDGLKIKDSLYVPIANAEKFKSLATYGSYIYAPEYDWSFINNYLCPRKITLVNYEGDGSSAIKYQYELRFQNPALKNIYLSTDGLNITLQNGEKLEFDYNRYINDHFHLLLKK